LEYRRSSFGRAKDATKLYEAVEIKLSEQRRFVLWWDRQEKQHGKLGSDPKLNLHGWTI
jgi:hypothetical protein